jgi:hypothetical protein
VAFAKPKASSSARGYGYAHQQERKRRVAQHTPASPCGNCGRPLGTDTRRWHLPHTADRSGYLPGLHCAHCNLRDGAQRGARKTNAQRKIRRTTPTRTSRPWLQG